LRAAELQRTASLAHRYARRIGTWIVLLRGVNLGSHNQIAMPALRATLEAHGCTDVRTHLQSGNVVLGARERGEGAIVAKVGAALVEGHGIDCPVVVRTPRQWATAIAASPFADRVAGGEGGGADPKAVHVTFLDAPPPPDALADVDPGWHAPDELVVIGREVHLWCPGGYGRTKLTPAYLERRTGRVATDRNWNTVLALAELAAH
jgi:uncharacterized protein (DUF1697 family)